MDVLDSYILRAARCLRGDNDEDADALCREIMGVFDLGYINPEAFTCIKPSCGFRYSNRDLGILLQKMRLKREVADDQAFGAACCMTITQHIRRLERAIEEGLQGGKLKDVYDSVDLVYANAKGYESYTDGLVAFDASGNDLCEAQTRLRIDKLKHFRDERMLALQAAEAKGAIYNLSANSAASSNNVIEISLDMVTERIDSLPACELADEDKTLLKGMISDLNTKDERKRKSRLDKLIKWFAGKGTDVFIATIPYIAQLVQSWIS